MLRRGASTLVVNRIRGVFTSVAVKAPAFGERRKAILQDIAVLTGGQGYFYRSWFEARPDRSRYVWAKARRVVVTKDHTTIVDGGGSKKDVDGRIAEIRREIDTVDSDWDREKLQERLAKLSGGVCVYQSRSSHRS